MSRATRSRFRAALFFISLLVCVIVSATPGKILALIPQEVPLQQAQSYYSLGQYQEVITLLEGYLETATSPSTAAAAAHRYLGAAYQQIGQLGAAIRHWEQALQWARGSKDILQIRSVVELLSEQAQAYLGLGQTQKAISWLREALTRASQIPEPTTEARVQGVLGNAYLLSGNELEAIQAYRRSLELARASGKVELASAALNNLTAASTRLAEKYRSTAQLARQEKEESEAERLSQLARQQQLAAREYALQAVGASESLDNSTAVRAWLNLLPFASEPERSDYCQRAREILEKLPASRTKAYLLVNLAAVAPTNQIGFLELGIETASSIGDNRALSFALGALGKVYEEAGDYDLALQFTQQAQLAAQRAFATDSQIRWQWQSGRIYRALGQIEFAKAAYRRAIASVQKLRGDIAVASKEFQLDFRDEVEPIYRQLLELLLEADATSQLLEALQVGDLRQLAELESFFGDICLEVASTSQKNQQVLAQTETAVITSVILPEKTYLIVQLPDGSVHRIPVAIASSQLIHRVEQWRESLEDVFSNQYLEESQALYNLLIRPMEAALEAAHPQNLVFVHDGILRNVPMAALHDGEQFLVEKYAIASSLGLKFTSQVKPTEAKEVLTFGLTAALPPGNGNLPNVAQETKEVQNILGGRRFLDREFTRKNLIEQIEESQYSVLHLATHGKFSGTLEQTFIQTFEGPLTLAELEDLLSRRKEPLELLTLSACQTAAGNDRSVLGLAGVAVRSGVRSALGTLWFINDAATVELITDFYQYLKQPGTTKAEALRQAQLNQIAQPGNHPSVWSSFILIGGWL